VADTNSDSGSFEELVMPLFARLYNFAHWLTQDRSEAEDLVQETCMKRSVSTSLRQVAA
jgi:DNA-directed RNA polymerase specialized sigma24 family protein